jgi:hypothetical protein
MRGCIDLFGENCVRAFAIVALSLVVIASAVLFFILSSCAISGAGIGGSFSVGERIQYALAALVVLAGIIAVVRLIRRLNREA